MKMGKKTICFMLSLLMVCSLMLPGIAAEEVTEGDTNLALKSAGYATVSGSTAASLAKINDGITTESNFFNAAKKDITITFSLSQPMILSKIIFYEEQSNIKNYTIEAATDASFSNIVQTFSGTGIGTSTTEVTSKDFIFSEPKEAQYIRLQMGATSANRRITEFEIWGHKKPLEPLDPDMFSGGTGTDEDPFLISTPQQFDNMRDSRVAGMSFKVTADIDLTELTDDYEPFAFSGKLTGDDSENLKTIHVNIDKPAANNVGLFSEVSDGVQISNLRLTGSVTGGTYVGGFIGLGDEGTSASAKLENCINEAAITGTDTVGGFAGRIYIGTHNITLNKLINKGTVKADKNGAGIIAVTKSTLSVTNCANLGTVITTASDGKGSAGIVAWNYGSVSGCYNSGTVSGFSNVGGIVGSQSAVNTIKNCYNNGDIINTSKDNTAGGIAGYASRSLTIQNCYNTGKVTDGENFNPIFGSNASSITVTVKDSLYLSPNAQDDGLDGTLPKNLTELAAASELGSDFAAPAGTYQFPEIIGNLNHSGYKVYTVTVTAGENGTAEPLGASYVKGGDTLTVTLNPAEDYQVGTVTFNGTEIPGVTDTYTTDSIKADAEISVTFAEKPPAPPQVETYEKFFVHNETDKTGSVTFGTVVAGKDYTVEEYGILFSMTDSEPTIEGGATKLSADKGKPLTVNGHFGVELLGELLKGKTYYTRTYIIHKDADGTVAPAYGNVSTVTLPNFPGEPTITGGTVTSYSSSSLADNVDFRELSFTLNDEDQTVKYISFDPGNYELVPVLANGTVLGGQTVLEMANDLEAKGYEVIAGINADFFDMDSELYGAPRGMMVIDGELICSQLESAVGVPTRHGVGITADNKLALTPFSQSVNNCGPKLTKQLTIGGASFAIATINRTMQFSKGNFSGISLFTRRYADNITADMLGTNSLLCEVEGGKLNINQTVSLKVLEPLAASGSYGALPEGQVIVTMTDDIPSETLSQFQGLQTDDTLTLTLQINETDTGFQNVKTILGSMYTPLIDGNVKEYAPTVVAGKKDCRISFGIRADGTMVMAYLNGDDEQSKGFSITEEGNLMKDLGCTDAVNFDSGGSASLILKKDGILTAEVASERQVANALFLCRKK